MRPPSIHPFNWNQQGASLALDWYIKYRFYDPIMKLETFHHLYSFNFWITREHFCLTFYNKKNFACN